MPPSIPDRWVNYKPIGKIIKGTRFIAFKVPLKERVSNNVDEDNRLDGRILIKMIPNLGLIIDLTDTDRYYDPNFFTKEGIEHLKLRVPGHMTPPIYLSTKFNSAVKRFIKNNVDNDKLIGVHCTHGVNRTGFFICNYMISEMTIEPNEAMNRFGSARGHKIERINYIGALQKLLQNNTSVEDKPAPSNRRGRHISDNKILRGEHKVQPSNWAENHRSDNQIVHVEHKVQPSNWTENHRSDNQIVRVEHKVQPSNWAENHRSDNQIDRVAYKNHPYNWRENHISDNKIDRVANKNHPYNWRDRREDQSRNFRESYVPDNRYVHRGNYQREERDHYHNYRQLNHINERTNYATEHLTDHREQIRNHNIVPNQVPLRFDYYNTRPRPRNIHLQRNTLNRNSTHDL